MPTFEQLLEEAKDYLSYQNARARVPVNEHQAMHAFIAARIQQLEYWVDDLKYELYDFKQREEEWNN